MIKMRQTMAGAVILFVFLCLVPWMARAADVQPGEAGDFGAGAIFGAPTGFSAKYWISHQAAVDGALAYSFHDDAHFQIHSDYLWHIDLDAKRANINEGRLPFYLGVGLRVLAGGDSQAGIRFPLGLSYLLERAPVEFFAEVAPVLKFAPDTAGDVDGGVGIRFYFKTGR